MLKNLVSLILCAFVVLITATSSSAGLIKVDPNNGSNKKEFSSEPPKLDQKITYNARHKRLIEVANDLTEITGICFDAGINSRDWKVQDRRVSIYAKGIMLEDLIESIARATHCKWLREQDEDGKWCYSIFMDQEAADYAAAKKAEIIEKARQEWHASINRYEELASMSDAEVEALREEDPLAYVMAKYGPGREIGRLFKAAPELKSALLAGEDTYINLGSLSPEAKSIFKQVSAKMLGLVKAIMNQEEFYEYQDYLLEAKQEDSPRYTTLSPCFSETISGIPVASKGVFGEIEVESNEIICPPLLMLEFGSKESATVGKIVLRALESGIPVDETVSEEEEEALNQLDDTADEKAKEQMMEPMTENSDDPELEKEITAPVQFDLLDSIAEASNFSFVIDNFDNNILHASYEAANTSYFDTTSELNKKLVVNLRSFISHIAAECIFNWSRKGQIIEMSDRQWFWKLDWMVPEDKLERWRKTITKSGTLLIDDLADMAMLTEEQIEANLCDGILSNAALMVSLQPDRGVLQLYSSLNSEQRRMLFSPNGLPWSVLSQKQARVIQHALAENGVNLLAKGQYELRFRMYLLPAENEEACRTYVIEVLGLPQAEETALPTLMITTPSSYPYSEMED